jgi:hypothetical protein
MWMGFESHSTVSQSVVSTSQDQSLAWTGLATLRFYQAGTRYRRYLVAYR